VTFGDHDPDDSFDPSEPPDPEQVARKLHEVARDLRRLDQQQHPGPSWDELSDDYRLMAIAIAGILLGWLRRQHG